MMYMYHFCTHIHNYIIAYYKKNCTSSFFSKTMTANWAKDVNNQNSFTGKNASLMYMESGECRDFPKFCGWICY